MNAEVTIPGAEDGQVDEEETVRPNTLSRLKITSAVAAIGGVCGAGVGFVLTYLGNVISGYHIPPSAGIYAWNAGIMATIGATLGPPMVWSMLRAVPLWRTLVEPAVAAVVASVLSMLFAPSFFGAAVPLAIFAAALRLRWEYRDEKSQRLGSETDVAELAASSAKAHESSLTDIP
jgi:hypothetical protein